MKIDVKTNQEAIEEAYTFMEHATERKPYPSFDGLRAQLDMVAETDPRAKTVRPEQLVDLRIIQDLDKSGFIDGLYRQPALSARTTARN